MARERIATLEQQLKKFLKDRRTGSAAMSFYQECPRHWLRGLPFLALSSRVGHSQSAQISKLVGVAPLNRASGNQRASRHIGRPRSRSRALHALHAAFNASIAIRDQVSTNACARAANSTKSPHRLHA